MTDRLTARTSVRTALVGLLLAATLAPRPALSEGFFRRLRGESMPGGTVDMPANIDGTVTRARDGYRNFLALMGGSPEGSFEDTYMRNLQRHTGGELMRGDYDVDDLVGRIVPGRNVAPIDNMYWGGHTVHAPRDQLPFLTPANPNDEYVGALFAGQVTANRDHIVTDQFLPRLQARMDRFGVTPDQLWAPGSNVYLKNCSLGQAAPGFIEEFRGMLPAHTTLHYYNEPFNSANFTQYPFGIKANITHNLGQQHEGLVSVPGTWEAPAVEQTPILAAPPAFDAPAAGDAIRGGTGEASVMLD